MKNLCCPEIDRFRIPHPMGDMPDEVREWAGAFHVLYPKSFNGSWLNVIASRGGGPSELYGAGENWDHVSVSRPDRCPTWNEMCWLKDLFFKPGEVAMQLHPVKNYINNHPYCLHLWRPIEIEIPLPPSILVGLKALNVA